MATLVTLLLSFAVGLSVGAYSPSLKAKPRAALLQGAKCGLSSSHQRCMVSVHTRGCTLQMKASYDTFEELEAVIQKYTALPDIKAAIEDESAPSPLSYTELQRNGRVDLVEGLMKHGGYSSVSKRLGLPVRFSTPLEVSKPKTPKIMQAYNEAGASLAVGRAAREERLAQVDAVARELAQKRSSKPESEPSASNSSQQPSPERFEVPLRVAGSAAKPKLEVATASPPRWEFVKAAQLDGKQRAFLLTLLALASFGFGRSSAEVPNAELLPAAQLAALLALGTNLGLAIYSTVLASQQAPSEAADGTTGQKSDSRAIVGPPLFWFAKVLFTGLGGLLQLKALRQSSS